MLIDQLRAEIGKSSLSAYRISRLADVDLAQLSKFRHHGRGLSLASAGRVCAVLGLRLIVNDGRPDMAQDDDHCLNGQDTTTEDGIGPAYAASQSCPGSHDLASGDSG